MFWVEINGSSITGVGSSPAITENQIEISEDIFNQIVLPSNIVLDSNGNITGIDNQQPTLPPNHKTIEEQLAETKAQLEQALATINQLSSKINDVESDSANLAQITLDILFNTEGV